MDQWVLRQHIAHSKKYQNIEDFLRSDLFKRHAFSFRVIMFAMAKIGALSLPVEHGLCSPEITQETFEIG